MSFTPTVLDEGTTAMSTDAAWSDGGWTSSGKTPSVPPGGDGRSAATHLSSLTFVPVMAEEAPPPTTRQRASQETSRVRNVHLPIFLCGLIVLSLRTRMTFVLAYRDSPASHYYSDIPRSLHSGRSPAEAVFLNTIGRKTCPPTTITVPSEKVPNRLFPSK